MIAALCSAVSGALAGVLVLLLSHSPLAAEAVGLAATLLTFAMLAARAIAQLKRVPQALTPVFPAPGQPGGPGQPGQSGQ
jgi:hypothetical protein